MKMKSVLILMLVFCLTIGLCACGNDNKDDSNDTKKDPLISATDKVTTPTLNVPTETESVKTTVSTTIVTENKDNTNETEPSEEPSASADASAPTSTTNTTAAPTQPVDGKATYTVIVTDEAGNPMPGVFVQLCLEACVPCMTNAQGVASYPNMAVADYKVSIISFPNGYTVENNEFHFAADTYEMTIVLKAAN